MEEEIKVARVLQYCWRNAVYGDTHNAPV